MMGAMASKKARCSWPAASAMLALKLSEVRGPVATITCPQSAGGRAVISSRDDRDPGMRGQRRRHALRKAFAVHRQGAARRQLVAVGHAHDQRAGAAHFLMQQAHGIVHGVVGAEGVGADQFRQAVALMGEGAANGTHLVQHHIQPGFRRLPRPLPIRPARRR